MHVCLYFKRNCVESTFIMRFWPFFYTLWCFFLHLWRLNFFTTLNRGCYCNLYTWWDQLIRSKLESFPYFHCLFAHFWFQSWKPHIILYYSMHNVANKNINNSAIISYDFNYSNIHYWRINIACCANVLSTLLSYSDCKSKHCHLTIEREHIKCVVSGFGTTINFPCCCCAILPFHFGTLNTWLLVVEKPENSICTSFMRCTKFHNTTE